MTVFIEATTDPFAVQRQQASEDFRAEFLKSASIRRPTRGYVLKEQTYAIIRVMKSDGTFLPVLDAAGDQIAKEDGKAYTTFYSNFFVMGIQEQRQEKQQIVETFGDDYIFFFGESPRMLTVSGMLLNTADFNWRAEWWENYERFFRGTKLVEMGARLYLIFEDVMVEGYIVGAQSQEDSQNPQVIQFNFQMFVTGYVNMSTIGDPTFPKSEDLVYASAKSKTGGAQKIDKAASDKELKGEAVGAPKDDLGLAPNQFTEGDTGSGKLLADSVREGTLAADDPATSSMMQRAAAARGDTSTLTFFPAPRGQGNTYQDNWDEFVVRGSPSITGQDANDSGDEWAKSAATTDAAVNDSVAADENGNTVDTTDQDYWDTMGRGGQAADEMKSSGGDSAVGQGVRRDLGGSDLGESNDGSGAPSGSRSVPFGSTPSSGVLV